ncbi:hypothetical protein [Azospirillum endophyticum]
MSRTVGFRDVTETGRIPEGMSRRTFVRSARIFWRSGIFDPA